MTELSKTIRLRRAALGLLGALALGGCAAGTVGDDWQCPLAQGQVCTSVAAADPAVADSAKPEDLPVRAPARQVRAAGPREPGPGCGTDCDVFAWLGRVFGAAPVDAGAADTTAADQAAADVEAPSPALPDVLLPAADGLRTGETVARIWIAPFVDADGVYHEAAWVRAVLEPAGWRLP